MKKYEVNYKVDAWYVVEVEAEDEDKAREKAEEILFDVPDYQFRENLEGLDNVDYSHTDEV